MAKAMADFLPGAKKANGYYETRAGRVTWLFGHVLAQATPQDYDERYSVWRLDDLPIVPSEWKTVVKKETQAQFKIVKQLLSEATEVVNAGDPDREGQLLVDEVLAFCRYKGPVKRVLITGWEKKGIERALASMQDNKVFVPWLESAMARQRADWLIGMNGTRAFTKIAQQAGFSGVWNVGRVKTPTLALVVRREREIAAFKPVPYIFMQGVFKHEQGSFRARWAPKKDDPDVDTEGRLINPRRAQAIVDMARGRTGVVLSFDTRSKEQDPPLPFIGSTLQELADRLFGMTPQEVLDTCQALYEQGFLTYPRTDCPYLPESQLDDALDVLRSLGACHEAFRAWIANANPKQKSRAWNDTEVTNHHGIIPTATMPDLAALKEPERRIYTLVVRAYVAQFLPNHVYLETKLLLDVGGEIFAATGRVTRHPGWRAIYSPQEDEKSESEDDMQALPAVRPGDAVQCESITAVEKKTSAPARYTLGSLGKEMRSIHKHVKDARLKSMLKDTDGIGTEATRPGILKELMDNNLLQLKGKHVVPTEQGFMLHDALPPELTLPDLTAAWEMTLRQIAEGTATLSGFMEQQEKFTAFLVNKARTTTLNAAAKPAGGVSCPRCKQGFLTKKKGKNGVFWGCSDYPKCNGTFKDNKGKPAL